ncbi:MAG: 50S ribosomal protein L11 methyltransferase [Saprospiraceae bacterium]|nr:50S ribosomal protein L11 methyltransferase [Saprospiraceae bacterium]
MYTQFSFQVPEHEKESFLAAIVDLPFAAFEETDQGFISALEINQVDERLLSYLDEMQRSIPFAFHTDDLPQENWNAIWESSFEEILIDDFCQIRAPFHALNPMVRHHILIEPRMAFGTGHHETTRLVIRALQHLGMHQMSVCDFGSGTGILAILSDKMGAHQVHAIEHDRIAYANLVENIDLNDCSGIQARLGDNLSTIDLASIDCLLVNITRNVILHHLEHMVAVLSPQGQLITSGFLQKDSRAILGAATSLDLKLLDSYTENDWVCHRFERG